MSPSVRLEMFLFHLSLFISLIISFYIFINAVVFRKREHHRVYFTWQFPMLLAIFLESLFSSDFYLQK